MNFGSFDNANWSREPGVYDIRAYIPNNFPAEMMINCHTCHTYPLVVMAEYRVPTCLRFRNAHALKDGRILAGFVEEEGTEGAAGWKWHYYVTEPVSGPVVFHVEVVDVCPKVS